MSVADFQGPEAQPYWWMTSGRDLSRMLQEAQYPEDAPR
jgi:hypothetical protein